MNTRLEAKQQVVSDLSDVVKQSQVLVAAHYRGMSVSQMSQLRSLGRERGVQGRHIVDVVENTAQRAVSRHIAVACARRRLSTLTFTAWPR